MTQHRPRHWHRTAPLRPVGVVGLVLAVPVGMLVTLQPTRAILARPVVEDGLERLHERGLVEWLDWTRFEVLANVAMLVPLALLLTFVLGRRRWWAALVLCVGASVGVEIAQSFIPGRDPAASDIVANTVGAVIGTLAAVGAEASVQRIRRGRAQRRDELSRRLV